MGTITLSVSRKAEKLLRDFAEEKYAGKKGSMRQVVEEALEALQKQERARQAFERQLAMMKKGFKIGYTKTSRDKLHERGTPFA